MGVLDAEQMASLIDRIEEKLEKELYFANRLGTLEEILKRHNLDEEQEEISSSYYLPNSKVLIIGATNANKNDIYKTFKKINISPDRIEILDEYEKLTGFDVEKLRNSMKYSDILVCAVPHKMKNIGEYPDMISMIEHNQEEIPLLNKITNESGELRFSISGLKKAIEKTNIFKDTL